MKWIGQRSESTAGSIDQEHRPRPDRYGSVTPSAAVTIGLRITLVAVGVAGIAVGVIVDPDFVAQRLSSDGVLGPKTVEGVEKTRIFFLGCGAAAIAAGLLLHRVLRLQFISGITRSDKYALRSVFALPIVLIAAVVLYRLVSREESAFYHVLTMEDSIVEWLTAIIYLIAFVSACRVARLVIRIEPLLVWMYALASGFFLFVALEEISYGQRIFGINTPEPLREINAQDELNIHNIASLRFLSLELGPFVLGLVGATAWLAVPLLARVHHRLAVIASFLAPPWFTATYFAPSALFVSCVHVCGQTGVITRDDQEVIELLLAFGFLLFVVYNLRRVKSARRAPAAANLTLSHH